MQKRFLNNADYLGIMTEDALSQLTRDKQSRINLAEEMAEESIVEYLSEHYLIEDVLKVGKDLLPYNRQITYPAGSYFYYNDTIYRATRTINGIKFPTAYVYWDLYDKFVDANMRVRPYTQRESYLPGDIVSCGGEYYVCLNYNGLDYDNIQVPGVSAWSEVETSEWETNLTYEPWSVVSYNKKYYALLSDQDVDWNMNPHDNPKWGLIGAYDAEIENYELSSTEYVVCEDRVFYPVLNPNPDKLEEKKNIVPDDPRNSNIKKHMLRLAVFELFKLISPHNVSQARITDYETSIMWLRDAARLKLNPQLPRRIGTDNKPVSPIVVSTFACDYDPNRNPWQI